MDPRQTLAGALDALAIEPLLSALDGAAAYAVGGWVREVIAGRDPGGDLDVAVDGDLEALLARLDPALEIEVRAQHDRFGAASIDLGGLRVDLTRTRRETYAHPGALPAVACPQPPAPARILRVGGCSAANGSDTRSGEDGEQRWRSGSFMSS